MSELEKLRKKVGTTTIPKGKNTFSIARHEKGLVLKKANQVIILDDSFEIQVLFNSIVKFWQEKER